MSALPNRPALRILRAEQAGYAFIEAAEAHAMSIRRDSEQWLQAAREAGFESARLQGAEEVSLLLTRTAQQVDAWLSGLEASLADLALGIAREVLDDMDDAERILRCTRKALGAFRQDQALTLWVAPADARAVRERLHAGIDQLPAIVVESDEQLQPGQARLSSPVGSVELGLDAQLTNLRRSLLPFTDEAHA